MLYTVFLCITLSLVSAAPADQDVFRLPPESVVNLEKIIVPCIEKSKADPDVFKKLIGGSDVPNDDKTKNFLYCLGTTGKYTDEEGHFNVERLSALLGNHPQVKPFEAALAECNKITKESPTETIYAMTQCFNEKSPVRFSV